MAKNDFCVWNGRSWICSGTSTASKLQAAGVTADPAVREAYAMLLRALGLPPEIDDEKDSDILQAMVALKREYNKNEALLLTSLR